MNLPVVPLPLLKSLSLDRLKNDLNIFLRVLELSMSDLINKDYPDFVNLSTNLVDLDKSINALKLPLEAIKNEVDVRNHKTFFSILFNF